MNNEGLSKVKDVFCQLRLPSSIYQLATKYSPRRVAVVREGEGPRAQPVVHPQHRETRPDRVAGLDGDQARDLAGGVRGQDVCQIRNT